MSSNVLLSASAASKRHRAFLYLLLVALCLCFWVLINSILQYSPVVYWNVFERISDVPINNRLELDDIDGLEQDDPFLIRYLQEYHVFPPSKQEYRYSTLDDSRLFYINESRKTTRIILKYLRNLTNGVFVEAGANNGADELSNTLILERDYNWTGLLVEGSPIVFPRLLASHRKSWKSNVLLSKYPHTKLGIFKQGTNIYAGRETGLNNSFPSFSMDNNDVVDVIAPDGETPLFNFEVMTVPLYSLIAACNFKTIDYLSLDVEGTELDILKSFPFDKVLIRTMIVEVNIMGEQKKRELIDFLRSKGYRKYPGKPTPRDRIFVHNSVAKVTRN